MKFLEHSDLGRRGHTQAWWMGVVGVAEGAETRGLGVSWPQGPRREGQGVTHFCPPPAATP